MLVLTRRLNESIVLPDLGVTIRVVAVQGRCVRLGIEAPRDIVVLRDELLPKVVAAVPELCLT